MSDLRPLFLFKFFIAHAGFLALLLFAGVPFTSK